MIDNYDEKNVEATLEAVRRLDDEDVAAFVEYEREHKSRKTVIEPLERELVEVTPVGSQYAAGLWFDDADDSRRVRRSRRVDRAIAEGDLEVV